MTWADFLAPVSAQLLERMENSRPHCLGRSIRMHREIEGIPDLEGVKVAIIGVWEDRGSQSNQGCALGPELIREELYRLMPGSWNFEMADLGNLYQGENLTDTYAALKEICAELIKSGICPLVIGGSQDLTYAMYRAYDRLEQLVNVVAVDHQLDLGQHDEALHSGNYLSHLVLNKPYLLFNFANIGYQSYFVEQEELDLMHKMFFDVNRLGIFKESLREAEPIMRDANLVSFDLSSIRLADFPACLHGSPNGFGGEEACALARYAGIADKVEAFGLFEYNPQADRNRQGAKLAAQVIWYFCEGYSQRKGDYPFAEKKDYIRFTVLINEGEHELIFYKSPLSERWWIEVPLQSGFKSSTRRHALVPCSHEDYLRACEGEIPDRWWRAYRKGG